MNTRGQSSSRNGSTRAIFPLLLRMILKGRAGIAGRGSLPLVGPLVDMFLIGLLIWKIRIK